MNTTASPTELPATTGSGRPKFELHRYNPRRAARGAEAVEVKVTWPEGDEEYLWMSKRDIRENIVTWGVCAGLDAALKAYSQNYQEVAGEALPPSIGSTQRITP